MIRLGRQDLKIRAGEKRFRTTDSFVIPLPVTVVALQPHAHQRARDVSLDGTAARWLASHPACTSTIGISAGRTTTGWQSRCDCPPGRRFESVFQFDNSDDNPRNPTYPAQDVTWGWRTADEMADIWVQVLTD